MLVEDGLNVIKGVASKPIPLNGIVCVEGLGLVELAASVNTSDPLIAPVAAGRKLTDNWQLDPAFSVSGLAELALTSGHVDGAPPVLSSKLDEMLGLFPLAGIGKYRAAFPEFSIVIVFGLSLLVAP